MATILNHIKWLYHEFGVSSVWNSGRDAWLIILARSCRMFAFGTNALLLALFFSSLNFTDYQIGLFMTLTLLGDVFLSLILTQIADRVGRRRVLFYGSILMVTSGIVFAIFENFWILLLAAVVGVISTMGGDFGPFRSIEESMLSTLTNENTRSDVFSWYVTMASVGACIGAEASGRIAQALLEIWDEKKAYHAVFWIYAAMGILNIFFMLALSDKCEAPVRVESENEEEADVLLEGGELKEAEDHTAKNDIRAPPKPSSNPFAAFGKLFTDISPETRSVMYKMWLLLMVDCMADGMVPYTLTNYYLDSKFNLSKSTLGDIQSVSQFLSAMSLVFAAPLSRRLGLINTMVFTHIPSSVAVLLFPIPQNVPMTVILMFIRTGLNSLDQAPRSAFIAAVVKPEERTAVMGITSMTRTLAAAAGPTITGILAGNDQFWIAFVAAGALRLAYDFGLWALFVNMKLYSHEERSDGRSRKSIDPRSSTDEEEMQDL